MLCFTQVFFWLPQVNMLQKSLLSQNEEQRRIAALEQQVHAFKKNSSNLYQMGENQQFPVAQIECS